MVFYVIIQLFIIYFLLCFQHDPDTKQCAPGDPNGNYIMFDKATSGIQANNDRFSKCSKDSIKQNVDSKRSRNNDCFTKSNVPICGNKIVEEGEACDCGDDNTCTTSACCVPASTDPNNPNSRQCKLQDGQQCDPSQGLFPGLKFKLGVQVTCSSHF